MIDRKIEGQFGMEASSLKYVKIKKISTNNTGSH